MAVEAEYLKSIEDQVEAISTCEDLRELAKEFGDIIQEAMDDIQEQIDALAPLLIPPTTLPGVIIWIKNMIQTIIIPYKELVEQLKAYQEALARITQKIAEKLQSLGCGEVP